jgi:rubrerythrin
MTETELLDPEEVAAGVRIVFDDDGTLTVEDGVLEVAGEGGTIFRWRCSVCGYIHEGPEPPRWCPLCGAEREMFEPVN